MSKLQASPSHAASIRSPRAQPTAPPHATSGDSPHAWTRWEFRPWWAVYAPHIPHVARLSFRYGGFGLPLIANAFAPLALLAGESKHEILERLPPDTRPATALIPAGAPSSRHAQLDALLAQPEFALPVILKPDRACRGQGLRLARTREQAHVALDVHIGATILQSYHPGPFEVGVLYARRPGASRGRILGITGKEFPLVTGDGRSTLNQLITAHPRLAIQHARFAQRLGPRMSEIPAQGQPVRLAISGNHCQGTCFRDHSHLATPALRHTLDRIADHLVTDCRPGLGFGRFDLRYASPDDLAQGRNLCVIEINGISSEATHAYDPALTPEQSHRRIAHGLTTLYRIGALNKARGVPTPSTFQALRAIWNAIRVPTEDELAD
jgi:hypothetical protein